jgi:predicted O-methyltransferase YrrM
MAGGPIPPLEEAPTYENIVDRLLDLLRQEKALPASPASTPWDAFLRLSDLIHETYEIPSTTITPMMRRLLFALGLAARPRHLLGIGTYAGYAFSWLLRDRTDPEATPFLVDAVGVDVDRRANALARRNCARLGHGDRLTFRDVDGVAALRGSRQEIDLLYLDLDDPRTGKAGYRAALEAAAPRLRSGALVLAHDACVPRFEQDMRSYHEFGRDSGLFANVWVFPVDFCGLSLGMVR